MSARTPLIAAAVAAAVAMGAAAGYWFAPRLASPVAPVAMPANAEPAANGERRILYWHDPMHPQQKFDKPGKSPFMDMQLEPVYADEGDTGSVAVSSRIVQNLGVRTVAAERGRVQRRVDAVGTVQADEHRIEVLQSRTSGWVEKLHVRAVNDPVVRGQLIAEIYSPELLAAQEEFLLLAGVGDGMLRDAARARLVALGLGERQIAALELERRPGQRVNLYAPIGGVVAELGVRQGGQVSPGMNLVSVIDLSTVWVIAEVLENQSASIRSGAGMEIRIPALPGETFRGKVEYIYPDVSPATRTVRVRASLPNPGMKLRPGMIVDVMLTGAERKEAVLVPAEAVIYTGKRNVVIAAGDGGRFYAMEVETGAEADGKTEILRGLESGARVVVSGQFLIDSEASLKSALTRLESPGSDADSHADHAAPASHSGTGVVKKVDASTARLTIAHGPIASLDWPAMTMDFGVTDKALLAAAKTGQQVDFEFAESGGAYVVSRIAVKP